MSKFLFLIICSFFYALNAQAQLEWRSKGPLYEDANLTVEIEYAMGYVPCDIGGTACQFRYKITKLKKPQECYINWRFDYFDCEHQLRSSANNLHITPNTKKGYILPENNQFFALRLVNNFNEVKRAPRLPPVGTYSPRSPVSLEPKAVLGKRLLNRGETSLLTLQGGYLAEHDVWTWYEGDCQGRPIGTGPSLTVSPSQTTVYTLRAEGKTPTACIMVTVTVSDANEPAKDITGRSEVCAGEKNISLRVSGGKLVKGSRWVWYQDQCAGVPIGEGEQIAVSPTVSTSYFARAEGPGGVTTCRMHRIQVNMPVAPAARIIGPDKINYDDALSLSVPGGNAGTDAQWVWYAGKTGKEVRIATGSILTIDHVTEDRTYAVRAESTCFRSTFVYKVIHVSTKLKPTPVARQELTHFFINGGIVTNDPSHIKDIKNYTVTFGAGKKLGWFFRAKLSSEGSKASYETNGTQINNYTTPGYYQYNGQITSKCFAGTAGLYLGLNNIAIYIGGGYGSRELYYGIDQYSYNSPYPNGTSWVKNSAYSFAGAELEGGLLLKAGPWNLMAGASSLQNKYTDYNLGIGLNF